MRRFAMSLKIKRHRLQKSQSFGHPGRNQLDNPASAKSSSRTRMYCVTEIFENSWSRGFSYVYGMNDYLVLEHSLVFNAITDD